MRLPFDISSLPDRSVVVGFAGEFPSEGLIELASSGKLFGVIFFEHNVGSVGQVRDAILRLREVDEGLEFLIDQEGGAKCRIGCFPFCPPSPGLSAELGVAFVESAFRESAEALAELGFTVNLAPVADLSLGEYIRDRSFGGSAEAVAECVSAAVRGIIAGGLKPCVKHFPGLGSVDDDPHISLPRSGAPADEFQSKHWLPFKAAFAAGCPMVMTTHIVVDALDDVPATYSASVVRAVRELGFGGTVITDDLWGMKGAGGLPPQRKIELALGAGHNVALWCEPL